METRNFLGKEHEMLVLSRKAGEKIVIADNIEITILEIRGNRIRIGVDAPDHVTILRSEVRDRLPEKCVTG